MWVPPMPSIRGCGVVCIRDPCCTWASQATVALCFKSRGFALQHGLEPGMLEFRRTCSVRGARGARSMLPHLEGKGLVEGWLSWPVCGRDGGHALHSIGAAQPHGTKKNKRSYPPLSSFFSQQMFCLMHTGKPRAWQSLTASPGFQSQPILTTCRSATTVICGIIIELDSSGS